MADVSQSPQNPGYRDSSENRGNPDLFNNVAALPAPALTRRISWGAVLAGTVVALVVQLLLSMLGLGIGFATIEPRQADAVPDNLGTASAIWWIITSLVALFAGGWVAGRMTGLAARLDGALAGFTVWALTTLISVYLLTTTAGAIISGTWNTIHGTLSAGANAVQSIPMPNITMNQQQFDNAWNSVAPQVRQTLQATGNPQLQPEQLEQTAREEGQQLRDAAQQAAQNPQQAGQILEQQLRDTLQRAQGILNDVDRRDLSNALAQRTGMSQAEATQTVQRWEQTYRNAAQAVQNQVNQLPSGEQLRENVEQSVVNAADATTDTLSRAAFWTFVAMMLGAGAALGGGALGSPQTLPTHEVERP